MAISPATEYPGKITAPNGNYDYGSAKSVTVPQGQDGTPMSIKNMNDIFFGFPQAILKVTGIVPSGNAETQLVSQYLQGICEIITNQNYGNDVTNTNNYVVSTKSRSSKYEQGIYLLKVTNANTGTATVNYDSLGVKNVKRSDGSALFAGDLPAGEIIPLAYDGTEMRLLRSGRIIQKVHTQTGAVATGSTQIPFDDTKPTQSGPQEGDLYLSQAIIPKNVNNDLIIEAKIMMAHSVTSVEAIIALFQDSTANALDTMSNHLASANDHIEISLRFKMTAGTISSTTFKIHAGVNNAGTTTVNGVAGLRKLGGVLFSSLTITEIQV